MFPVVALVLFVVLAVEPAFAGYSKYYANYSTAYANSFNACDKEADGNSVFAGAYQEVNQYYYYVYDSNGSAPGCSTRYTYYNVKQHNICEDGGWRNRCGYWSIH